LSITDPLYGGKNVEDTQLSRSFEALLVVLLLRKKTLGPCLQISSTTYIEKKKQNVIVESLSKNNTYLIHRQYILITSNILNSCSIYMSPYLRPKNE